MPAAAAPTGYFRMHIVGAVCHQVFLRDGTLARMRRAQG